MQGTAGAEQGPGEGSVLRPESLKWSWSRFALLRDLNVADASTVYPSETRVFIETHH